MWAMMQKFRICAGAVKVRSAKLLMGISWSGGTRAGVWHAKGIDTGLPEHNCAPRPARRASPMLSRMASQWKTLQRFAENLMFNEAPKLIQHGIRMGIDALLASTIATEPPTAITAGRPVTRSSVPTAHRAREVTYAPDLDGRADPGEIVWTWVAYEDDPTRGKDRPVLVVGRDRRILLGLMLSSQDHHQDDPNWIGIGAGAWDYDGRPSWVRLDRVLDVPEEGIRREGAILDRSTFELVATRLRVEYSWS